MDEMWKSSLSWQTVDKKNNIYNIGRYFTNKELEGILVLYDSKGNVVIADQLV